MIPGTRTVTARTPTRTSGRCFSAGRWPWPCSTAKTLETFHQERPLSQARFAADQATLTSIRTSLQLYYGQHGEWPTTKEAVTALMSPPPAFQCEGNDFSYDPATGEVRLLRPDLARC